MTIKQKNEWPLIIYNDHTTCVQIQQTERDLISIERTNIDKLINSLQKCKNKNSPKK